MYICIEGGIGVGKTSLTNILADELQFEKKLEIVEENPYLKDFYKNTESVIFQTEMFFLTHRYGQVNAIKSLVHKDVVSDYTIFKNKLFANLNLNGNELQMFIKIFDILNVDLPTPDLLIFLKADVRTLKKRIIQRNRFFEQNIDNQYLQQLIDAYEDYFQELINHSSQNVLVIECDNIDFVHNNEDKQKVLSIIKHKIKEING